MTFSESERERFALVTHIIDLFSLYCISRPVVIKKNQACDFEHSVMNNG